MANQLPGRALRAAKKFSCTCTVASSSKSRPARRTDFRSRLNPSGLIRCNSQPVLTTSRIRLPVLGGISGSKTTMWNTARASFLQLEGDTDTRQAVVTLAGGLATAPGGDRRVVQRGIATGRGYLGFGRHVGLRRYPVAHHRAALDAATARRFGIELFHVDATLQLGLAAASVQ